MVHIYDYRYTSRADRERAEQEEWLGGIDGEDIGIHMVTFYWYPLAN